ncbi:Primosomal protein N', partial [termite gut metagenome]
MKKYVDVILPLPIPKNFTYSFSGEQEEGVQIGCRVVVPFGRKKFYTAIVCGVHEWVSTEYEIKEISAVLDTSPVLLPVQFEFWRWLADYYLCTQGDIYKAAIPSGLKLESETVIVCNPDFETEEPLSANEQEVLDSLRKEKEQPITKLQKESEIKDLLTVVKSLLEKEAIYVKEELRRTYKPKTEIRVRFTEEAGQEERLKSLFDELSHAPKQLALLMKYVELSGYMRSDTLKEVSKKALLQQTSTSPAIFSELTGKHVFETYYREVGRLDKQTHPIVPLNPLNEFQQKAFNKIHTVFAEKQVCLLHGVTSAGKTEIYIHLIEETIRQKKQVLYLLPEIALTTQITERLRRVFGSRLGVYHSKFPDVERTEIW